MGEVTPYNSISIKTQLNSNLAARDRPHYENDLAEDLRRVARARVIIDKAVVREFQPRRFIETGAWRRRRMDQHVPRDQPIAGPGEKDDIPKDILVKNSVQDLVRPPIAVGIEQKTGHYFHAGAQRLMPSYDWT